MTMRNTVGFGLNKDDRRDAAQTPCIRKVTRLNLVYGGLVGLIVSVSVMTKFVTGPIWMIIAYSFVVASVLGFLMLGVAYQPMLRWYAERRIARGECGVCEFSLDGLSPEPDGCTLCPECGAAWKLSGELGS